MLQNEKQLKNLCIRLEKIFESCEGSKITERDASIEGLTELLCFLLFLSLKKKPILNSSAILPLSKLMASLLSLNNGVVMPFLEPLRKKGAPKLSWEQQNLKRNVAMTVYRLQNLSDNKLSLNESYEKVAQWLNKCDIKRRGKNQSFTPRTVRYWCENIAEDSNWRKQSKFEETMTKLLLSEELIRTWFPIF